MHFDDNQIKNCNMIELEKFSDEKKVRLLPVRPLEGIDSKLKNLFKSYVFFSNAISYYYFSLSILALLCLIFNKFIPIIFWAVFTVRNIFFISYSILTKKAYQEKDSTLQINALQFLYLGMITNLLRWWFYPSAISIEYFEINIPWPDSVKAYMDCLEFIISIFGTIYLMVKGKKLRDLLTLRGELSI